MVDVVAINVIMSPITAICSFVKLHLIWRGDSDYAFVSFFILLIAYGGSLVFCLWYYVFLMASPREGTLGKRLMGIQGVSVDGTQLTLGRACWRLLVSVLIFFLYPIDLLILVLNKKKQGLHDRLAGTYVIYKPEKQKAPSRGFEVVPSG